MAKGFKHGAGGGDPLNFRVLNGTSAPASPKENDIWVNSNTAVSSWDFSATEPNRRSRNKNLFVHPFYQTTMTINGVTITDNGDGTLTLNGTCTANTDFRLSHTRVDRCEFILQPGIYHISGNENSSKDTHHLKVAYSYDNWATAIWSDGDDSNTFVVEKEAKARANLTILKGTTLSNVVYKPQLEKGSVATDFVKGDATGQVWIQTGETSPAEFNALKKNNLKVYPVSVKQYVGGAWITKEAKTYQGGAWVDWGIWFYDRGNTFDDITGGWVTHNNTTLGSDGIIMAMNGGAAIQNIARPNNAIDFTDIKTVKIVFDKFTASDTDVWIRCVIKSSPFTDLNNAGTTMLWHDYKPTSAPNNSSGTISLDTSNVNGLGYLHIVEHNLAGNMTSYLRILEVKGEK